MTAPLFGLSLTQPWATLMALRYKSVETRSWAPPPDRLGQLTAIQAAKSFPSEAQALCLRNPYETLLRRAGFWTEKPDPDGDLSELNSLPRGVVVAVGVLRTVFHIGNAQQIPDWFPEPRTIEYQLGDYGVGRYAWLFENVIALKDPVPIRGLPMVWAINGDDKAAILTALAASV